MKKTLLRKLIRNIIKEQADQGNERVPFVGNDMDMDMDAAASVMQALPSSVPISGEDESSTPPPPNPPSNYVYSGGPQGNTNYPCPPEGRTISYKFITMMCAAASGHIGQYSNTPNSNYSYATPCYCPSTIWANGISSTNSSYANHPFNTSMGANISCGGAGNNILSTAMRYVRWILRTRYSSSRTNYRFITFKSWNWIDWGSWYNYRCKYY